MNLQRSTLTQSKPFHPRGLALPALFMAFVLQALFLIIAGPAGARELSVSFLSGPSNPTSSTSATFEFAAEQGISYECSLDGAAWSMCQSGVQYGSGLAAHVPVTPDVRYGTAADGTELLMDVYLPEGDGPWAGVLVIHGGGWKGGNKSVVSSEAEAFARAGFAAFAVDFRNAPGNNGDDNWPAQLEDLQMAMSYVRSLPYVDSVGVFGKSSGGHLAQYLGTAGEPGSTRPDAVASLAGPSKLEILNPENASYESAVSNLIGCSLADCPDAWRDASPFYQVSSTTAPMFLGMSADDPLVRVEHIREMDAQLAAFGVSHVAIEGQKPGHVDAIAPLVWGNQIDFMAIHLGVADGINGPLLQGPHAFSVRAIDSEGNLGEPAVWNWTVDATPPAVTITSGPSDPTLRTFATFGFAASESGVMFTCSLDGGIATPCGSGVTYENLTRRKHVLVVFATDGAGNAGPPDKWVWQITRRTR
jgi:acetyl esterase/lipase